MSAPWIRQIEAARRLGISRARLHEAIKARRMRTARRYGLRVVHMDDVEAYRRWMERRGGLPENPNAAKKN